MNRTVDELIEAAKSDRVAKLPKHAQELIADLARRLDLEHRTADGAVKRARQEVETARALAAEGPADSDTFLDLPRALYTDEEDEQKPLGRGVTVEFRSAGDVVGEGYGVKIENGELVVSGINRLAVYADTSGTVRIFRR